MDPQILAMLMMMMAGDPTSTGKSVNNLQDITGSSLMNPMWGILTGTYDPMLLVPQSTAPSPENAAPMTFRYAGTTGTMSDIARGVLDNMTRTEARTMLKNAIADQNSDVAGQNIDDLMSDVDMMFGEIRDYNDAVESARVNDAKAAADNPFSKAGLPSMLEQWSPDTLPSGGEDQAWAAAGRRAQSSLKDKARELGLEINPETGEVSMANAPLVERQNVGRRGSPSARGANPPAPKGEGSKDYNPSRLERGFNAAVRQPLDPAISGIKGVLGDWKNAIDRGGSAALNWLMDKEDGGTSTAQEPTAMWKTIDPKFLARKAAYDKEAGKAKKVAEMADAERVGRAMGMNMFGQSPATRALSDRMAMLMQLSQFM